MVWKNTAQSLHDVTTDPSLVQNKNDVALPAGAKPFDSGFMPPGASWSYTFSVPGRYAYACIPHEKDHMVGEITVTKNTPFHGHRGENVAALQWRRTVNDTQRQRNQTTRYLSPSVSSFCRAHRRSSSSAANGSPQIGQDL